jgi:enoyl-CoA hydratase/carnithine racemase
MPVKLSQENSIAILQLNNPKKLNALSGDFINEIYDKIANIEKSAKVLIITGCDKAFAAGVDVSEINTLSYENAYLEDFIDYKWEYVFNIKIPVIAAVSGYALGGGFELALMCDIIVAAKNAIFGFPEVNLGIMPGMGGTQMLPKIVGAKIASEIMMTGRFISAEEAASLKIVSYLTEERELLKKSMELAEKIAEKSTLSTQMIKEAIRLSQNIGLNQGIKTERQMFRSLFSTSYKEKGIRNFLNKKK